jgi:hypothetical protein
MNNTYISPHIADFPDYSLPPNDLRQQSVAIGGLEIRQPSGVDDRIHRPIAAGDGLSISMPVRMGGNSLLLRSYTTSEAILSTRSTNRLPLLRSNTNASIGSIATTSHLETGTANERRTSDFWWQFPGFLSASISNVHTEIHDGTPLYSDSDITTQNDLNEQNDYTSVDDREGENDDNGYDDDHVVNVYSDYVNISSIADRESNQFNEAMERTERNPLLDAHPGYSGYNAISIPWNPRGTRNSRGNKSKILHTLISSAPAILVATIINVLGAVSYGM